MQVAIAYYARANHAILDCDLLHFRVGILKLHLRVQSDGSGGELLQLLRDTDVPVAVHRLLPTRVGEEDQVGVKLGATLFHFNFSPSLLQLFCVCVRIEQNE